MRVRFLGTNGWYDTKTGNTTCVFVETADEYIIFDAGSGFYKASDLLKKDKPAYLFLSHYHLDHVIGLHALAKFRFRRPLDIFGPPGLAAFFRDVIKQPYTAPRSFLSVQLRLHEISGGVSKPGWVSYLPLKHSTLCYGYSINREGKKIVFCTDTGICENLFLLAKGADLFISECSLKPGQINRKWPHLNPQDAAKAAARAGARRLALLHFDSEVYLDINERKRALRVAKNIFKNSLACMDDLVLKL
jgi:ribonuclease BN (tRNA processing enzyme)